MVPSCQVSSVGIACCLRAGDPAGAGSVLAAAADPGVHLASGLYSRPRERSNYQQSKKNPNKYPIFPVSGAQLF